MCAGAEDTRQPSTDSRLFQVVSETHETLLTSAVVPHGVVLLETTVQCPKVTGAIMRGSAENDRGVVSHHNQPSLHADTSWTESLSLLPQTQHLCHVCLIFSPPGPPCLLAPDTLLPCECKSASLSLLQAQPCSGSPTLPWP